MSQEVCFSSNALVVLKKRYLRKNNKGEVTETPSEMLERVAQHIATIEKKYSADSNPSHYRYLRLHQAVHHESGDHHPLWRGTGDPGFAAVPTKYPQYRHYCHNHSHIGHRHICPHVFWRVYP